GHLPEDVVERLLHDPTIGQLPGGLPGMEVEPDELRLVVEHLLEVGDEPARVDRVAVEAAAELVVDPAPGRLVEGASDQGERVRGPGPAPDPAQEVVDNGQGDI